MRLACFIARAGLPAIMRVASAGCACTLAALVLVSCKEEEVATLTREQLLDPATCQPCHPTHYEQWSASMHAYASRDPVFLAMNKRGQREASLGEFCVNCHAPMAVREGALQGGRDIESAPGHLQGVTCYFCHNAVGIGEPHNNSLKLADDTTMRGPLDDALRPSAHGVAYSRAHDRNALESSALCGACHDVVTPANVHLERTFAEYQQSIYPGLFRQPGFDSCVSCHMPPIPGGVAAVYPNVPTRTTHEHLFPAVDVPLTDFPHRAAMQLAVESCALPQSIFFNPASSFQLQADSLDTYVLFLESQAGHAQPSGASQDRRMWVELTAYDAAGALITASGALADDEEDFEKRDQLGNPVWTFHDRIFNEEGQEVHMFWDAAPSAQFPSGFEPHALPLSAPGRPSHGLPRDFRLGYPPPARVEIRVRMRPIALAILRDLVRSGDLDPGFVDVMPTFTVASASVRWKSGNPQDFELTDTTARDGESCARYKCLLRANPNEDCSAFKP